MIKIKAALVKFAKEEDGLTSVEYAVAGALVVAGLIGAFTALGTAVEARINALAGVING